MSKRISGASFDTYWGTDLIHVEKLTLDITDNTALAQTKGVPDGYVDGDVSAEGEIELSIKALATLKAQASSAGSWRGIPVADMLFTARPERKRPKLKPLASSWY